MGVVASGVAVRERAAAQVTERARAPKQPLTPFHQRVAAEQLTSRSGQGAVRLAPALAQTTS